MRRYRGAGPAVAAVAVLGAVVGCAGLNGTVTCAGAEIPAPSVLLDVSAWLPGHPQATPRACVDASCETLSGATIRPGTFPLPVGGHPDRTVTVTVSADQGGRQVLQVSRRVRMVHHQEHGPCGTFGWWQASVSLTATGALQPH
ncbi:hypothetical protein [Kitasatospora sp. NBC_01266]|uniref:hypothetical protein n=1 Tax=Kitasatospora sp. NBC_01266 TaxID=2903572 RepID=UPI002E30EEA0|nr:hypothetical protein [Kitasatospora sp. NBC_01266]